MATKRGPTAQNSSYNIVLLGDRYTGKSSLLTRYIRDKFQANYTQGRPGGIDCQKHQVKFDQLDITFRIYDIAGLGDMNLMNKNVVRNAHGIMLVFDVSRQKTLFSIPDWMGFIKTNTFPDIPEMVIVGNKSDIPEQKREGETTDMKYTARDIARNSDINFFEVSAKTNYKVQAAFSRLVDKIIGRRRWRRDSVRLGQREEEQSGCYV